MCERAASTPIPGAAAGTGVPGLAAVDRRLREWLVKWLKRSGQLWRANLSVTAEVADNLVRIPVLLGNGLENVYDCEPWLLETLRRLFARRGGAFVDVGMNVGQTLLKAKALDRMRPYFGFEPNPGCCHYVEWLIQANRFPNCTIVPAGLSDRPGVAVLRSHFDAMLDSCATLVDGFVFGDEGLDNLRVATLLTGDEVVDQLGIGDIAAIKIDVEGAELDVLSGLERTLVAQHPYIVCEILPVIDTTRRTGQFRLSRQEALLHLLRRLHYSAFRVHGDVSIEPIETIDVHSSLALSNYIFAPDGELTESRDFQIRRNDHSVLTAPGIPQ